MVDAIIDVFCWKLEVKVVTLAVSPFEKKSGVNLKLLIIGV
jgi:hypothetical protein